MNVFVTRQPIFDDKQIVIGYELLFREPSRDYYRHEDGDDATLTVMSDSFLDLGIERLTSGKPAFVNFTRRLLLDEVPFDIHKDFLVVEILENIEPDAPVIEVCRKLKQSGYRLVLDDFVFHEKYLPLMELADMIKVDFLTSTPRQCETLVRKYNRPGLHFCAEKLETRAQFERARDMGYSYFQGYFFCRPEIVSGKRISGYKLTYLQILDEMGKTDLNFDRLESILKRDVALSYKLLRLINSAYYGLSNRVKSIKHALVLLGIREIRRWVTVMALHGMGNDKPEELLVNSITRAKFCELTAEMLTPNDRQQDFFLMGLFSQIDAFLDRPMAEILDQLPIYEDVKSALLGEDNQFRKVFEIMLSYEKGEWERFLRETRRLNLNPSRIMTIYLAALDWSNGIFSSSGALDQTDAGADVSKRLS
jgi:EAL and modified HD-GYP domain-containing signal transduction protein